MVSDYWQSEVKGGRRQGRQRKRWEDNIRKWTGLEFAKSQRAVENREKMEETGCEIICGAQTTFSYGIDDDHDDCAQLPFQSESMNLLIEKLCPPIRG